MTERGELSESEIDACLSESIALAPGKLRVVIKSGKIGLCLESRAEKGSRRQIHTRRPELALFWDVHSARSIWPAGLMSRSCIGILEY
jgi:hypothetical protein